MQRRGGGLILGDINESSLEGVLRHFNTLEKTDHALFYISTEGGCFYTALGIFDIFKAWPGGVTCVAIGPCMSAGVIILLGATHRYCTERTTFLIHYGSASVETPAEKNHEEKMYKYYKHLVADETGATKRTVTNWLKEETYMDSTRALRSGIVHKTLKGWWDCE